MSKFIEKVFESALFLLVVVWIAVGIVMVKEHFDYSYIEEKI